MSGFLGYDPSNLDFLRTTMADSVDKLLTIRSSDPEATSIIRSLAGARTRVEQWTHFIADLQSNSVLSDYTPARLNGFDLRFATLYALVGDGWQLLNDPVAVECAIPSVTTPYDAAALARMLATWDLDDLFDTNDELDWFAAQLTTIGGDPALLAAFEAVMAQSASRWVEVCDALFHARLGADADDTAVVDRVFAGVAKVLSDPAATAALLSEMMPLGAAVLLSCLDVDSTTLADLSTSVMRRWMSHQFDPERVDMDLYGRGLTPDVLFRRLARDPAAATQFLRSAAEDPRSVFTTAADLDVVDALLTAGIDPAHVSTELAGEIVVPLMRYLVDDGLDHAAWASVEAETAALGATMISPWIMHFGIRAQEWNWEQEEAEDALKAMIRSDAGFDRLMRGVDQWQRELISTPLATGEHVDFAALNDIARTVTRLDLAFRDAEIDEAVAATFFTNLVTMGLDQLTGLIPYTPVAVGASLALPYAVDGLEALGVLPPDEEAVRASANKVMANRLAGAALLVLGVAVTQLTNRGLLVTARLPQLDLDDLDEDCAARAVWERANTFIDSADADARTKEMLHGVLNSMLNGSGVELLCDGT